MKPHSIPIHSLPFRLHPAPVHSIPIYPSPWRSMPFRSSALRSNPFTSIHSRCSPVHSAPAQSFPAQSGPLHSNGRLSKFSDSQAPFDITLCRQHRRCAVPALVGLRLLISWQGQHHTIPIHSIPFGRPLFLIRHQPANAARRAAPQESKRKRHTGSHFMVKAVMCTSPFFLRKPSQDFMLEAGSQPVGAPPARPLQGTKGGFRGSEGTLSATAPPQALQVAIRQRFAICVDEWWEMRHCCFGLFLHNICRD